MTDRERFLVRLEIQVDFKDKFEIPTPLARARAEPVWMYGRRYRSEPCCGVSRWDGQRH